MSVRNVRQGRCGLFLVLCVSREGIRITYWLVGWLAVEGVVLCCIKASRQLASKYVQGNTKEEQILTYLLDLTRLFVNPYIMR